MGRTWETQELPVLRMVEAREPHAVLAELRRDLPEIDVDEVVRRLERGGYLERDDTGSIAEVVLRLTGDARVRLGQWPGDELAEAFLHLLRQRADETTDEGERRRLDGAVSSLAAVGGQTLSAILAQLVMQGGP